MGTIQYSLVEAQKRESEETDTVTALASLSMVAAKRRFVFDKKKFLLPNGKQTAVLQTTVVFHAPTIK